MGMGIGGKCGMFFLILLNTLFLLLGIGLLVVGILMKVQNDFISRDEVIKTLNEVSLNGTLKLGNVANSLSIFVICLGVFVIVISAIGAFGACCKNRCLLVTYAIIVLLIFVAQVVAVALWFVMKDKVENEVKGELKTALTKYNGVTSTDQVSIGWDLLFIGYDCCGVEAVTATQDQEFSGSAWWASRGSDFVPASCCIAATEDNYKSYTEVACTQSLTTHQKQGCYDAIKDWIKTYQVAAIAVGITLLVVEFIAVVFACLVCRAIGKKDMIV